MGKTVIYQMLLRLWGGRGQGRFSTVDAASLRYLKELGVTHVWYTGLLRHAVPEGPAGDFVKGDIGSPYAVCDYYDTNPYLADSESERMSELEDLINRTHAAGLKSISSCFIRGQSMEKAADGRSQKAASAAAMTVPE